MDKYEDSNSKLKLKNEIISKQIDHHTCPICLQILTRPIFTPCNHAFCLGCYEECAELSIKNICPLCRFSVPKDFQPSIDKEYAKKLKEIFEKETKEREKQLAEVLLLEKQFIKLKFNYGNTWKEVPHPKKPGETSNNWRAHLKLVNEDSQKYIKYVEFELHPTYAGDKIIKKCKAPFEIERLAWGYFNLPITIYFTDLIESDPIVINHMLYFQTNGKNENQIVKVKLKQNPIKTTNTELSKTSWK